MKQNIMVNPKNFLQNVLETDLAQDRLFTADKVLDVDLDQSDVVFTTSLVRKRPIGGYLYFDIDEPVQEKLHFRLRFYSGKIMRLMIAREPIQFSDESIMLQWNPELKILPGCVEEEANGWLATDDGSAYFRTGKGSFAPQFSPDGQVQLDFQGQDHFVENLIDAFPAFCLLREDGSVTMGIELFFIGGGSFADILLNYRRITGFPAMPPDWSFGVWMSKSTYYTDEEVSEVARRLRAEGYPADVLHLDTGWFAKEWVCDRKFSKKLSGKRPNEFTGKAIQ